MTTTTPTPEHPTRGTRQLRKRVAALAVLALCAPALAACGQQPSSKASSGSGTTGSSGTSGSSGGSTGSGSAGATVQMWIAGNTTTKPIYLAEAAAYEKAHPGVKIEITDLPGSAYTPKLDAALAAGKEPAIYQLFSPGPQMQTLVAGHHLADLSSLVKGSSSLKSRILPSALVQGQVHGKQYGIPYNIFQEAVVLYSKPDFKKAGITSTPKTWAELMTDVAKLKAAHLIPVSISGTQSDGWYEWWLENYEVHLAGLSVSNAVKKGNLKALDSAPVVKAATAMQQLVKADAFEPGYTTTDESNDVPYALLGTSKAAILLYGAFTPNFVQDTNPSFVKGGQMGYFSFPLTSAGSNDAINLSSQPQLVVNANESKATVNAAEAFLSSWVYSPAQEKALAASGNVGPEANAAGIVSKAAPAYLKGYMEFELSEASDVKDSFLLWSQFIPTAQTDTWEALLQKLFSLKVTPQEFAQQAGKM